MLRKSLPIYRAFSILPMLLPTFVAAEWRQYVGVADKYYYRGLTYYDSPSQIHVETEYQHESGFFSGGWLGHRENTNSWRGRDEFILWLGYAQPFQEGWLWQVSFNQFYFPGSKNLNYEWQELNMSVHYNQAWSFAIAYNQNQFGEEDQDALAEITHRHIFSSLMLDISAGAILSNNDGSRPLKRTVDDNHYYFYEVGFSIALNRFRPRLSWISSNQKADVVNFGQKFAKNDWVLSMSYSF